MSKEKEEAERIVRLFRYATTYNIQRYAGATPEEFTIDGDAVLKCAIIHVKGLIKDNNNTYQWAKNINLDEKTIYGLSRNIDYWQEVIQEIEKL